MNASVCSRAASVSAAARRAVRKPFMAWLVALTRGASIAARWEPRVSASRVTDRCRVGSGVEQPCRSAGLRRLDPEKPRGVRILVYLLGRTRHRGIDGDDLAGHGRI